MKIVFTICSNNYLSQAKTLGDSLVKYNSDYKFIIGLCDKKSQDIDYSFFDPYEIIEVEKLNIANFEWMIYNYYIIELNTAIKPFFFQYLLQQYQDIEAIMYFDPDIKVFDSLSPIETELQNKSALLTPHILSSIPLDGKSPYETTFLNYGLYNLGFLAIRPSRQADKLLEWWAERLSVQSFNRVAEGLFVDQLPMNFAPLFFEDVQISRTPGYNYAYWNFHERKISLKEGKYYINENCPLTFLHFSSFKPIPPLNISIFQTRFDLDKEELLYKLYAEYADNLITNKYFELKEVECFYSVLRNNYLEEERLRQEVKYKEQRKFSDRLKSRLIRIITNL